ncbi:DUF6944 family repetitive protein [Jeotgalibacillus proteolyticus]|uniref:AraC family transcriptional regulator n=1 Tax=Jeotgalibacillus proteolyticus TaxID=2082395 RepID=A0A2S5G8R7_9BACL|nr:hypothetical protein [Jeotgalibacillus proteolyticus]PPA69311.1 hypothetical protein C4B60_16055 [Jeotgalibacillus proteolyticus]
MSGTTNDLQLVQGSFITAIGTVTAAFGSTPSLVPVKENRWALELCGNTLQATGNAIEADAEGTRTVEVMGKEIQSLGNITVIAGLLQDLETERSLRYIIAGNLLQATGALVSFSDQIYDDPYPGKALIITGSLLQAAGNSIQAVAGIYMLKDLRLGLQENPAHLTLLAWGAWVQAAGTILAFIGQYKKYEAEQ